MDPRRKGRSSRGRGRWRDRRARAIDLVRGVLGHRVGPAPHALRLTIRGERRLRLLSILKEAGASQRAAVSVVEDAEEERDALS